MKTRPTSDRVRESVFMSLEPFTALRIVDLFAGTGALGIEALSRGAAHADFAERDRAALEVIRKNLEALALEDRATVWSLDLERDLSRLTAAFAAADLVLLDPPYGSGAGERMLERLGGPGVLRPGTRVVMEHHAKEPPPGSCGTLTLERRRRYGETEASFYRAAGAAL